MSRDHFAYASNTHRFLAADALQDQPFAQAAALMVCGQFAKRPR